MRSFTTSVKMSSQTLTTISRFAVVIALLAGAWAATACTVVHYVDDDDGSTTGPLPQVVDMLVMMDLSRGTANLSTEYGTILSTVVVALAEQNVTVRKAGLAPLYARAEGTVPIVYGEGDPDGEFGGFGEAIAFYTYDDGAQYLQDSASSESENLATLGSQLNQRAVYHPTTADGTAVPYYTEPADGFVVLYLTAAPRRCSASQDACNVDGRSAVEHFTRTDGDGVSFLEFPGGSSLPLGKVFHGAIVTAEKTDYDTFYDMCAAYPNFPVGHLDVMQPSEQTSYYEPLVEGVKSAGGAGEVVDLCEAMSGRAEPALLQLAASIRGML